MDVASALRLVLLAAIWGGSFLCMRIAVPAFGPGMLIGLRVAIAAVFLWGVCRLMHKGAPLLPHWKHYLILGLFNSALPFLCFAYAAQTLGASLLSILNATAPIFGAIIGMLWLRTPVTRTTALGLALGIAGVATLVGGSITVKDGNWWLAIGAGLLAPVCYGIAGTYTKKAQSGLSPLNSRSGPSPLKAQSGPSPLDNAHGSMWAATLLALPGALFIPGGGVPSSLAWVSVVALGVLCTGAAYLLYFRLIRDIGATRALSVTFLIPVFGVLWGVLLLGEHVGLNALAGGALVLLGVALANGVLPLGRKA